MKGRIHQGRGAAVTSDVHQGPVLSEDGAHRTRVAVVNRPEERLALGIQRSGLFRRCGLLYGCIGPGGTLVNPGLQNANFLRAQCSCGRHLQAQLRTGQPAEDLALGSVAGNNDHAGVASPQRRYLYIEAQPGKLLRRTVTGVAIGLQNGLNLTCEIDLHTGSGRQLGTLGRSRSRKNAKQRKVAEQTQFHWNPFLIFTVSTTPPTKLSTGKRNTSTGKSLGKGHVKSQWTPRVSPRLQI